MRILAAACALVVSTQLQAAAADCAKIDNAHSRLTCYDRAFAAPVVHTAVTPDSSRPSASTESGARAGLSEWATSGKEWLKSNVTVRSDAQVAGFAVAMGDDPALVGYTRIRGQDATTAQFAMLVKGPVFGSDRPMSTFLGIAIDRDTLSSEPTDVRQAIVGGHWVAVPIPVDGNTGLQVLLNGRAQKDYQANLRREVAVAQGLIVHKPWQHGRPGTPWSHITTPYFGLLRAHSNSDANAAAASRTAFYAGLTSTIYPFNGLSDRISFSATAQLTRDAWISSSFDRQTYRYAKASINWRLTQASEDWIKPYLTVSRETGSDPVTGKFHKSKTFAGISLQITPQ